MNIVFALLPEKGHINPYIGPAQALATRGHQVTVIAPGGIAAQINAAGLSFDPSLIPPTPGTRPTSGAELVALIQDPARLSLWIEALLLDDIPAQVDSLQCCLRSLQADAVVIDPLYYAAAIAAHCERLPWASVSNSLNPVLPPELDSALLRTTRALAGRRAAIFAGYGLHPSFKSADVLSPFCNIAFATQALCGAVANVELAGPSFPLHSRGDDVALQPLPADRSIVYASFGSQIYHWPAIFAKLRAACRGLHLVLAAGDLANEIQPDAHCQVYRYAPQRALLERADVFVTHGGANSFMEAIASGVPMLLSPMCNDQFHQAWFLEKAGIGLAADLQTVTEPALAGAIHLLLADGPHRKAMRELSESYQQNGALRAATLIERMCR